MVKRSEQDKTRIQAYWWQKNTLWLIVVLFLTSLVYLNTLQAGFTTWDDPQYVTANEKIQDFSTENILFFFRNYHYGIYHPLTMLSLMLDYDLGGLEPALYHLVNLLLHLINTLLVFVLIRLLFKHRYLALLIALFFGIHPLHAESVAWVSGRKDVLYALFYLSSLILYTSYIKKSLKCSYYYAALFLFLLSLFSKGMALSLSFCLVLIDYYLDRKLLSRRVILEKLPFFLLSALFGWLAIQAPESLHALSNPNEYTFPEELQLSAYSLSQYLTKGFLPLRLSAYHPYPESISPVFYLYVLLMLFLVACTIYAYIKKEKMLFFALMFFFIHIIPIIRSIHVVSYIIADRYMYLALIAIPILIFDIGKRLIRTKVQTHSLLLLFVCYAVFLGWKTHKQVKSWQNDLFLYSGIIESYPWHYLAYHNRGHYYEKKGMYENALMDYSYALERNKGIAESYLNRANVKKQLGDPAGALLDYNRALEIRKHNPDIWYNRGLAYESTGEYQKAISDYTKAIGLKSDNPDAYSNRGVAKAKLSMYREALRDFDSSLILKPSAEAYSNRGSIHGITGNYEIAIQDFKAAIALKENYAEAYLNMGLALIYLKRMDEACSSLIQAEKLGAQKAAELLRSYCTNKQE
jgi:protein O-mannosyl-transferase